MSKKIKNKIVPKLRFPEFVKDREWETPTLEHISERVDQKVGDKRLTTVSISAGIGFVSQAEKFSRDISGQQYKNYVILKKGEFAYNKGNSKKFPQGCIYKLKEFEEVAAPYAFICFKVKDKFVADFYQGYFENNYHGKQIQKFITSGARMDGLLNISPSNFFSIVLPTPANRNEQQKIADCLSSLDELISAENQKLESLKAHKKSLMQQLFPAEGETVPKFRFEEFKDSGEWEEKSIEKLFSLKQGVQCAVEEQGLFQAGGQIRFIRIVDLTKMDEPIRYINDPGKEHHIDIDDLFMVRYGTPGVVGHNFKGVIANNLFRIIPKTENGNNKFYYFLFNHIQPALLSISGSSTMPALNFSGLNTLIIPHPKLEEQQKIASCLSSLDELITAQSEKIDALKMHKKGLMQQLFPNTN